MNEAIKALALLFTGGFIVGISILFSVLCNHRRTTNEARKFHKDIEDRKRDITESIDRIDTASKNIGRELSEAERVIEEVRNQKFPDNGDN